MKDMASGIMNVERAGTTRSKAKARWSTWTWMRSWHARSGD